MPTHHLISVNGFDIYDKVEQRTGLQWNPEQVEFAHNMNVGASVGPTTDIDYQTPGYRHKWPINSIAAPHTAVTRRQYNDEILHPNVMGGKPNRPIYKHAICQRQPFQNMTYPGPIPSDQNYGPNGSSHTQIPGIILDAQSQMIDPFTYLPTDKRYRMVTQRIRVQNNGKVKFIASDVAVPEYPLNNRGTYPQKNCTVDSQGAINQADDWERTKTKPFFMLERCPADFSSRMPRPKERGGNISKQYVNVDAALSLAGSGVNLASGVQDNEKGAQKIKAKGQTGGSYSSNVWIPANDDADQYPIDVQQFASFCVTAINSNLANHLALGSVDTSGTGFMPMMTEYAQKGDATCCKH